MIEFPRNPVLHSQRIKGVLSQSLSQVDMAC